MSRKAQKFTVDMPEGGMERFEYLLTHHECPESAALFESEGSARSAVEDLVLFPYGLVGQGMPRGVPFEVQTSEPCGACNKILRAWFEWKPRSFLFDIGVEL